jgi:hypothetical protein
VHRTGKKTGSGTDDPRPTIEKPDLTWREIWAIALIEGGLSEQTWDLYTLRDIVALQRRRGELRSRDIDYPTARILHAMYNIHCRQKGDAVIPFDQFMQEDPATMDEETLKQRGMAHVKALVMMLGGEVNIQ